LENARKHKNEYGDEFVSVEHILQAFPSDKRFGQQLFRDLKIDGNGLKDAISAVRGSQRVTDQSMSNQLDTFPLSILGSFCLSSCNLCSPFMT
jgi:ATP-dependent Clp protease ATP-binding subunit ClpA